MEKIHLIGNAHIDPVWLWRWQEGYAEIKATFRSALDRMEEYPDFVFTSACAAYYKWVEENSPAMFREIQARVREGRWKIVGGMWIQPDCNVPSGESFARHFLYSQNYFQKAFGQRAVTGYNVDSFGHNASLPKLLRAAGMENYVMMRPGNHENPDVPGFLYWWEAPDGSRVLTFRIPDGYCNGSGPEGLPFEERADVKKLRRNIERAETAGLSFMHFYGVGNHGGGPTIRMIDAYKQISNEEGTGRIFMSGPDEYFAEMRSGGEYPVWNTELQHHASLCYSTHSEMKRSNRRAENRLTSAEIYGVMAKKFTGLSMDTARLDKAWQNVLFNQFHDIMGGCSIREAYDDVREMYGEALNAAAETVNASVQSLSWAIDTSVGRRGEKVERNQKGMPIAVFNPLAWQREIPVQINWVHDCVTDETGSPVPVQRVRASRTNGRDKWDTLFMADVPAMGWRGYRTRAEAADHENTLVTGENTMENEFLKLTVEPFSGAVSLYDKKNSREVFDGKGCIPLVIDVRHADTWGHNVFSFRDVVGCFGDARIQLMESGPVRAAIRVISTYNRSELRQDFYLYKGSPQVEVSVQLDWREKFKLLKLSFPVGVKNDTAAYDIPFGHVVRPANGTEESGQMWFDVTGSDGQYGLAVPNDGKYSFDVLDNDMRMTVANGSLFADHYGQDFRDDIVEYLDQGIQNFRYALLPHAGSWEDAGVVRAAIGMNTEEIHVNETYHEGPLPQKYQGIEVSAENVIVTALKPALDGDGQIIRVYESAGRDTSAEINLPLLSARLTAELPANSVATYQIRESGEICKCDLTELIC